MEVTTLEVVFLAVVAAAAASLARIYGRYVRTYVYKIGRKAVSFVLINGQQKNLAAFSIAMKWIFFFSFLFYFLVSLSSYVRKSNDLTWTCLARLYEYVYLYA